MHVLDQRLVVVGFAMLLVIPSAAGFHGGEEHHEVGPYDATMRDDSHTVALSRDVPDDPGKVGSWLGPVDGGVPAVNLAVLPGGDILYYSGVEADESQDEATDLHFMWSATPLPGRSRVADIDLSQDDFVLETIPDPEQGGSLDIFCSGTTVTPDGRVVAPGATQYYTLDDPNVNHKFYTPLQGWEQSVLFENDDTSPSWSDGPDMSVPRWYPSALQLPNGETMVASGIRTLFFPNTYNTLVETLDPEASDPAWEDIDTSFHVADGAEVEQNVGPDLEGTTGNDVVDGTHQGLPNLPMYPRMHVVPSGPQKGEVLYTGNGDLWGPFGQHVHQQLWGVFQTLDLDTDVDEGSWALHSSSPFGPRNLGASVPLMVDMADPQPRYLSFGGTLQQSLVASPTSEVVDASGETVETTDATNMSFGRWSVNGVLLPDGTVLAIGGSVYDNVLMHGSPTVGPVNPERYDPETGEWELMAPAEKTRAYHSTAALLPDGRVLVGGHVPLPAFHHQQRENGNAQVRDSTFELYEPPYLHHPGETRPVIDTSTAVFDGQVDGEPVVQTQLGQTVALQVDGLENGLDSVTLMRPGATTHQYDADQRGVELNATVTATSGSTSTVTVTMPGDSAFASPGHYMLFVNEDTPGEIFPSEAAWIHVSG